MNKAWEMLRANYKADNKGRYKTTDAMKVASYFAEEAKRLAKELAELRKI